MVLLLASKLPSMHQCRQFHLQLVNHAKKAAKKGGGGGKARGKQVPEPEPVADGNLLVTRCCGLNKLTNGEDPILKDKSEYPEWLWSLHRGKKKNFTQLDPSTKDYWYSIKEEQAKLDEANKSGKTTGYFIDFKPHEIGFVSRFDDKKSS